MKPSAVDDNSDIIDYPPKKTRSQLLFDFVEKEIDKIYNLDGTVYVTIGGISMDVDSENVKNKIYQIFYENSESGLIMRTGMYRQIITKIKNKIKVEVTKWH